MPSPEKIVDDPVSIDDFVRKVTEHMAAETGPAEALRIGARLRSMLLRRRPSTIGEAVALVEAYMRDGDR